MAKKPKPKPKPKRTAGSYLRRSEDKVAELDEAFDYQDKPKKKKKKDSGYTLE